MGQYTLHRDLKMIVGLAFSEVYHEYEDSSADTPFDLTLYGVRMDICTAKSGGVVLWNSDDSPDGSAITITDAPNGIYSLILTPVLTASFPPGNHYYDIELYLLSSPDVVAYRRFSGRVSVIDTNVGA